ncbi:SecDF P1 head subdomain-containing protein [Halobacillus mangrovi]|uniref:SecDF P1 head subdomain domain-containing protein n=1 Tax=Halobacillus mangrovi TaxID=402384 RepID=A0A1W5ZYX5_9BACI|nr:hypothetical protein [Halobacillus mangrovi]ARI78470.1 hypothetical protein HM131_17220 [Halobacillus mangrovi]
MRLIISFMAALLLLIGCQQSIDNKYSHVSIKDQEGEVLVTEADFEKASFQEKQDQVVITVIYEDEQKFKEITESHLNEEIHIYLGDKKIASPKINQVIDSESIQIEGDYSEKDAKKFIDVINQ